MPLYFIAVVAPGDIDRQVLIDKQYMREQYGCKVALRSPAHITLIPPFAMAADNEAELSMLLRRFVLDQPSFKLYLKNYNFFSPRVIFIDIIPSPELSRLKTNLEDFILTSATIKIKKEERPFHPHMTIANRDLEKKDFYAAKEHFLYRKFEASFKVGRISLLKNSPEKWEVLEEYDFKFGSL